MQTSKTRNGSAETPQKTCSRAVSSESAPKISPRTIKGATEVPLKLSPRVVRQLKTSSQDSESASPSTRASRTPKDRSSISKVTERKSPRSPAPELQKKHLSKAAELESQISQLENDLKKVKEQLTSSEAEKKQAEEDADESKRQLLELSLKLEESQKQLAAKKSNSEETEHANASECQDSELEVTEKQHLTDSDELSSAVSEINSLKIQLENVSESEAAQRKWAELSQAELNDLKVDLTETRALMEDMKNQVEECKESEAQARALVGETLMQLETAKKTVESLRSDANDTIASELEQSRARVNSLEELVRDLKADIENANKKEGDEEELSALKSELEQLKSALEASEMRYNAEQVRVAEELTSAWQLIEKIKDSSRDKEDEIEKVLKKTKSEVEELKANLMDKENELQGICEENSSLHQRLESMLSGRANMELEKEIQKVKSSLMDKEAELQNILEENETLKLTIKKKEVSKAKINDDMAEELETARSAEREALMKLGYLSEEVDKSHRKVARVSEQLDAAQAASAEMEAELRKMKVQSDQWRKAAEAAAAMISSTGNNGKFMDRTASMDNRFSPRSVGRNPSPYSDDGDEDLLKRKAPNMLKKIGVLWKKPQK